MADARARNHGRPLPPLESRWKKGVSGNPRGRRKKEDNSLTSRLKEKMKEVCPADPQKRTWEELIVLATLQQGIKGNAMALREVWDRIDGKVVPKYKIQDNGADRRPVTVQVVYEDGSSFDSPSQQSLESRVRKPEFP